MPESARTRASSAAWLRSEWFEAPGQHPDEAGELTASRVADGDEFIANLWKVHCRVKEEGYV